MGFIISVLGVVLIIEGIPYFAAPRKAKAWARLIEEVPDRSLRVTGFVAMLLGLIFLYFAVTLLR